MSESDHCDIDVRINSQLSKIMTILTGGSTHPSLCYLTHITATNKHPARKQSLDMKHFSLIERCSKTTLDI